MVFGAYVCATYVLSLRGVEGLLVDFEGMIANKYKGDLRYFVVALLGKIKGEHQGRCHLLPSVKRTSSDVCIFAWINLLVKAKVDRAYTNVPRCYQIGTEKCFRLKLWIPFWSKYWRSYFKRILSFFLLL